MSYGKPWEKDELEAFKGLLYLLPVLALGFTAYCLFWVFTAESTSGTVVSSSTARNFTGRSISSSYSSVVEYTAQDGQVYSSKESWPSTFFKYEIGDEVTVYFFKGNPQKIILGFNSSLIELTVVILVGWLFLLWFYKFKLVIKPD